MTSVAQVWLITATSFGLAKEIALSALERGHRVIVTSPSRNNSTALEEAGALVLELNVTEPWELKQITEKAIAKYGRIDILVNAAGNLIEEAIEEATPEHMWDNFNTIFGMLCVIRAALIFMRKQQFGIIANFERTGPSHSGADRSYSTTKLAYSALADSLRCEIESSGLPSTVIESKHFRAGFLETSARITTKETQDRAGCIVDVLSKVGSARGMEVDFMLSTSQLS